MARGCYARPCWSRLLGDSCPRRHRAPGAPIAGGFLLSLTLDGGLGWWPPPAMFCEPHRSGQSSPGATFLAPGAPRVPTAEVAEGRAPAEPEGAGAMALLILRSMGWDLLSRLVFTCKPRQGPHSSRGKHVLPGRRSTRSLCPERLRASGRWPRPAESAAQRSH